MGRVPEGTIEERAVNQSMKEKRKTEYPFAGNENHIVPSFDRLEQSKGWEMPNAVI